jgi:sulfur-oxidizing protein SoxY
MAWGGFGRCRGVEPDRAYRQRLAPPAGNATTSVLGRASNTAPAGQVPDFKYGSTRRHWSTSRAGHGSILHIQSIIEVAIMNIRRRMLLQYVAGGAVVSTGVVAGMLMPRAVKAALPPETFFASSPADAIKAVLGGDQAAQDGEVELDIPGMVEVADMVPVTVSTALDDVQSITIVADKNPNPIVAYYRWDPALEPYLATRIRLAESGPVEALVMASGKVYRAAKNVEISISGCGDPESGPPEVSGSPGRLLSDNILVKATKREHGLVVRALFTHPMSPPRRGEKGKTAIPGYFIQEATAQLNGKTVLRGDWSSGVARNPYLSFKLRQVAPGDMIRLSWSDNAGNSGATEVEVG